MQTIIFNVNDKLDIKDNLSICLGYFDGLHLGHKKLIEVSKNTPYKSALLTFIFDSDVNLKNNKYLTSLQDKQNILSSLGVDYLFVLRFDNEVKNLLPSQFIDQVLMMLNPKVLVVGEDYRFGKMAKGDINYLKSYSNQYEVKVVEEEKIDNKKIGTSLIIEFLKEGNLKMVNELLGYYYKITGVVETGYKLGNKYDFPTANVKLNQYVMPKKGVYASIITIDDKKYYGMTNIGNHPTVNELDEALLEVNIFDFNQDIYQKVISVELVNYIREERNFSSIKELYNQLKIDKKKCIELFENKKD